MRGLQRQHGGVYGTLMILTFIGAAALLTLKVLPIYMNEMKVAKAVAGVAGDRKMAASTPHEIRRALEKRWDIEDIQHLDPKDVKVLRKNNSRLLQYDYEVRTPLMSNVSLILEFKDSVPMVSGGG